MPSFMIEQCQAVGSPYSGNAAGYASTTDLTGLPLGPFPQNNGWHSKGIGAMAGYVHIFICTHTFCGRFVQHAEVTYCVVSPPPPTAVS